jgi:hypothetical protein
MQRFQSVRRWASLEPWCTLGVECARSAMREGKPILHRYPVRHQSFTFDILISRYCNALYSISNKNFDIVPISSVQRLKDPRNLISYLYIEGLSSISKSKPSISKVATTLELERPQHGIRYRKRYMIFSSKTGASVPRPPSIDSNDDREMDLNHHNDNMDQVISARQFPTAQSGPIAQFLNSMPDWINMIPEDINRSVGSLPNPSEGHIPSGILLQEAIVANEWHHIHDRHYQIITLISYLYTIS